MAVSELNQVGFERLLALLDTQEDALDQLRERLDFYFEQNRVPRADADMLTDETISRVTQKLAGDGAEDQPETIRSPRGFCVGFARNVLREFWRARERGNIDLAQLPPSQTPSLDPGKLEREHEESLLQRQRLACMRQCLGSLPARDHELIIQNCTVEDRGELAGRLGLSINALRIRVSRVRKALKACLANCLKKSEMKGDLRHLE